MFGISWLRRQCSNMNARCKCKLAVYLHHRRRRGLDIKCTGDTPCDDNPVGVSDSPVCATTWRKVQLLLLLAVFTVMLAGVVCALLIAASLIVTVSQP